MKNKQKITLFLSIAMVLSIFGNLIGTGVSVTNLITNPTYYYEPNMNNQTAFHVVDNVWGDRYVGFEITGISAVPMPYGNVDQLNLSILEYDEGLEDITASESKVIYLLDSVDAPNRYFAITGDGEHGNTGILATLMIPLNTSNVADLYLLGEIMTEIKYPQPNWNLNVYGGILNLTQFKVVGNELQLYNETSGYYANMTFDPVTGILETAAIRVDMYFGEEMGNIEFIQTVTREMDFSKANPLDETDLTPNVGDGLLFKFGSDNQGWEIESYNITSEEIIWNEMGQPMLVQNATKYIWNQLTTEWDIENSFVNEIIGGGNDFNHYPHMDGPSNLLYPIGTTGEDLNKTYFMMWEMMYELDISSVGPYWAKWENASGQFVYLELNSNGLLLNMTFKGEHEGQPAEMSRLAIDFAEIPTENLVDGINWGVSVGDELVYEFEEADDIEHGKYTITAIEDQLINVMAGAMPASIVNATFYNWTAPTWTLEKDPWANQTENSIIGAQNEETIAFTSGPNLIYALGTTGQDINNSYWGIMTGMLGFDLFSANANSWNATKSGAPYEWCNITLNSNGIAVYYSYNLSIPGQGTENITLRLINRNELPGNLIPTVSFTFVVANLTVTFTAVVISGDGPLYYEWDFGDGSKVSGTTNEKINPTHTYTAAGTYVVRLTVTDANGDIVFKEESVVVVAPTPPKEEPEEPAIPSYPIEALMLFSLFGLMGLLARFIKRKK